MIIFLFALFAHLCVLARADEQKPWVVLYIEDWAIWQRNYGFGTVEKYVLSRDLPVANMVLQYAFLLFNPKTCEIIPGDTDAALSKSDPQGLIAADVWASGPPTGAETGPMAGVLAAMITLKARYPYIKLLPSLGGWSLSHTFHDCLKDNMDVAVKSVVDFVRVWGMDGVDLDWEYPECVGGCGCQKEATCPTSSNVGDVGDWERYKTFTKKIRDEFDVLEKTLGRHLLITAAFGMNPKLLDGGNEKWGNPTPWEWLCGENVFDFLNLMAYDFYGPWAAKTGQLAPLYTDDAGPADMMSIDDSVTRILARCSNPSKLLMGLATYGKTWSDVPKQGSPLGLYQESTASTIPGGGTWEAGTISFWDIQKTILPSCTVTYHDKTESNTAYCDTFPASVSSKTIGPRDNKNVFITFEDAQSWTAKMKYAKSKGFGGAIIWAGSDMGDGADFGDYSSVLLEGLFSGWYGKDVTLSQPKAMSGSWPALQKWPYWPCPLGYKDSRTQEPAPYSCPDPATLQTMATPTPVDPIETGSDSPDPNTNGNDSSTGRPGGSTTAAPGRTTTPGGDDRWWTATSGSAISLSAVILTSCLLLFFI